MIRVSTLPRRFRVFKGYGGEGQPLARSTQRSRSVRRPRGPLWRPTRCRLGQLSLDSRCRCALRVRIWAALGRVHILGRSGLGRVC